MARRNGGFVGQDGLDAPDPPTGVAGTAGIEQVSVAFTAPSDAGTSAITGFNVQLNDGAGTIDTFSGAVATGKSFDASNQVTTNSAFTFSNDGTKVFILDLNEVIYQYDLSTAYDISTISYNNVTLDPGSQIPANQGVYGFTFSADGTKIYIMSYYADVYQYTLSTAFALNTASYANKTHDFKTDTMPSLAYGIEISNDGTRVYISHAGSDNIFEYILSTAHDISTAGNVNHTFSIASNTVGHGLTFNSDGTELYSMAEADVEIFKYTLTTAFDLSTASFSDSIDVSGTGATYYSAVGVNADATKFYVGLYQGDYFEYAAGSYLSASPIVLTGLTNGTNYTAKVWAINAYGTSAPSAASVSFTPGSRGVFGGGYTSSATNIMQFINIDSAGNSADFGDLALTMWTNAAFSSATRGIFGGGRQAGSSPGDAINYITIASTGNAADFGDISAARRSLTGLSNSTRGVFAGGADGSNSVVDIMEYITIANTGNTTDFGNLAAATQGASATASSTRGVISNGYTSAVINTIQYITIASTGNASDFGDSTIAIYLRANGISSSGTRGTFSGGDTSGSGRSNVIDYITIASAGNATDFGDLAAVAEAPASLSSTTLGIIAGGTNSDSNVIQFITIATTGNTSDFGDLAATTHNFSGCSNGHGGLG